MTRNQRRFEAMLVGPIERFDQRGDMFRRGRYDPAWIERAKPFIESHPPEPRPGYLATDVAMQRASWTLEDSFARGNRGSGHRGLYSWESARDSAPTAPVAADPADLTHMVKRAARLFGAALVGVAPLDRRWLYSAVSDDLTGEARPLDIPDEFRYAVALAIEMDYGLIRTSPTAAAGAATGVGYSRMAFVAGLLAEFIRGLGYRAMPCGNDTALSIPIAVQAGLGELGRNGLLITEKYGPRVRLCKVFTDMPLVPDEPRFFGVEEFCRVCMTCAETCPSRAISFGDKTSEAPTISNNPGVLKWPSNPEHCYKFWIANRMDCANCIRSCPFNQPPGMLHDLTRALLRRAPSLDRFLAWAHRTLKMGDQADAKAISDG